MKRPLAFGAALFQLGVLGLFKSWTYYGSLLRGWDAQFYYAQGRALLYDGMLDVTASLEVTPWQRPFDRDADGFLERPPRLDGRIFNKYPVGLSLLEIP